MATEAKRVRKPRTSPEHDKLVMYCEMSIKVLDEVNAQQQNEYLKGQIVALKSVLRQLGVEESV